LAVPVGTVIHRVTFRVGRMRSGSILQAPDTVSGVYAPFEVVIVEGGRVLQPDGRNQIMLPPGIHELRLANRTLAYEAVQRVEVKPGEGTTLRLTPPSSTLTVMASEAAEVWLDGARVGETPLNAAPVPLGTHEVVVKREAGGERRFTVTIGTNPFTLDVDFR
jgi:hypothetical protein